jgi:hypothetical protein
VNAVNKIPPGENMTTSLPMHTSNADTHRKSGHTVMFEKLGAGSAFGNPITPVSNITPEPVVRAAPPKGLMVMPSGALRTSIAMSLWDLGLAMTTTSSLQPCEDRLLQDKPEWLLLDFSAGAATAAQIVQWLRIRGLATRVVVLGVPSDPVAGWLSAHGVAYCSPLPVNIQELTLRIGKMMRGL